MASKKGNQLPFISVAEGTAKKIKALRPTTPQVFYLGRDQSISFSVFWTDFQCFRFGRFSVFWTSTMMDWVTPCPMEQTGFSHVVLWFP